MIGQVQEINGTKQIVPLDGMSVPQLDLATPNNAVLKFDRTNNKIVGATKVKDEDYVIKYDYSMTGTADIAADIQSLVNAIIAKGVGTYSGEFKRTNYSFGSYTLTYFLDGTTVSVCGIVIEAISNINDSNWRVSYVNDGTAYWTIEKDVSNVTYTISSPNTDPVVDIRTFMNTAVNWPNGTYAGYFNRPGATGGHYSISVTHGWNVTGSVVITGATNDGFIISGYTGTYEGALASETILPSRCFAMNINTYIYPAGTNLISLIESLPTAECDTFRFYCPSGVNTPFGNNIDVDLWVTAMKIENSHYNHVIVHDVRSTCVWEINSYEDNGATTWTNWIWVTGTGGDVATSMASYNSFPIDPNVNVMKKNGNVVSFTFRGLYEGAYNLQDVIVGTIPAGFRPSTDQFINVRNYDASGLMFLVKIGADGNVAVLGVGSTPVSLGRLDFWVSATWMVPNF